MHALWKAIAITCLAGPKIAAPHRFTSLDDVQKCILSGFYGATHLFSSIESQVRDIVKGMTSLENLNIAKMFAIAVRSYIKDYGVEPQIPTLLGTLFTLLLVKFMEFTGEDLGAVISRLKRLTVFLRGRDLLEFISVLKTLTGYFRFLELSEISERFVELQNVSLSEVINRLSQYTKDFMFIVKADLYPHIVSIVKKHIVSSHDIDSAIYQSFIDVVKEVSPKDFEQYLLPLNIPRDIKDRDSFLRVLRIDRDLRSKGVDLSYTIPFMITALTILSLREGVSI